MKQPTHIPIESIPPASTVRASLCAALHHVQPLRGLPIIAKAEGGSLTAAVKLVCLDCSGFIRQEVRTCGCVNCPLYPHRPFQGLKVGNPNDAGLTAAQAGGCRPDRS